MRELHSIGISHHTAALDVRERMWFTQEEARTALRRLADEHFGEAVLVSTCNRTEFYGIPRRQTMDEAELKRILIEARGAGDAVRPEHLYAGVGEASVRHLFDVAAGIDSMVIGDIQILNQVKESFLLSRELNALGPVTNRLMQAALHVGKRVRSETALCEGAVSVSYAAVELATKIYADLSRRSVLLIGAGETGELTLRHLLGRGIGEVKIANRTREKAEALVAAFGGAVVEYDRLQEALEAVDIVITSVSSPSYVVHPQHVRAVMRRRAHSPLFIIDIGVPRNVDPASRKIDNVFLYDMDALNAVVDRNLEKRKAEIPRVRAIIAEEVRAFFAWFHALDVGPAIQDLRNAFEQVRQEVVEKNINKFSAEDRERMEVVTRQLVNKLLHQPMTTLKHGAENGDAGRATQERVSMLRELFGIGGGKADGREP
jgi:glutamyl-tRNA reductase